MLKGLGVAAAGTAVASCAREVVKETVTVKETVIVEGEPVEVEVEKIVTATPEPAPEGPKVVKWWHGWGGRWVELGDEIAQTEQFKEFLPGVEFEPYGANSEKLLTAMAGGDPPDGYSQMDYFNFMARDANLDVTDWIETSDTLDLEDIVPARLEASKWQGVYYGVPAMEAGNRFGFVMNGRMAEEAGLDPDNPPTTWDEVYEWHLELTKFDSAGNLKIIGFDPLDAMGGHWSAYDGWMPCTSWGWDYFDEDAGEYNLDAPGLIEYLYIVTKFYDHMGPDNVSSYRQSFGRWGGSVNAEVQALQIEGYWMCGETAHEAPQVSEVLHTSWLPVPESRRGTKAQCYGGHLVCIPRESKNPEGGFRWAEFLNTDFARDWVYERLGWLNPSISWNKSVDSSVYTGLPFYVNSTFEADQLTEVEKDPLCEFGREKYHKLAEEVYRHVKTPEEATAELQQLVQNEYDRTFKM
jgi:multiple sugar transport system substrate-binding protein